jgi:hypothetical protein
MTRPGGFTAELLADEPSVVKLSGELDVASVPQLQACVELLGPASAQNVCWNWTS